MKSEFNAYYYIRNASDSVPQRTTTIKLSQSSYKLTYGAKSFTLNPTVTNGPDPTYKSSNASVVSVSSSGKITVKGPGMATVTVTCDSSEKYTGASQKVKFTIAPKKTASVKAASPKAKTVNVTWKKTVLYQDM